MSPPHTAPIYEPQAHYPPPPRPSAPTAAAGDDRRAQANCLERLSDSIDTALVKGFDGLAGVTTKSPWMVILGVVVLSIILGQGVWVYDEELSPEKQFTPQDTQAVENEEWVDTYFGAQPRPMRGYFVADAGSVSVLDKASLEYMLAYHDWVTQRAYGEYDGKRQDFNASCQRYSPADGCQEAESILKLWGYNGTRIANDPDVLGTVNAPGAWRRVSPSGPDLAYYLNDVERDAAGRITRAAGARMTFNVNYPRRKVSGSGMINPEVDAFEQAVSDGTYDKAWNPPTGARMSAYMFTLADQETEEDKAIDSDVSALIIGYVLLIIFTVCILARNRVKYSQGALAFLTVLSVGLSTISAYGLCWFIGIPFNNVVQVLVLLLLGLGVDDAFIIMFSWWDSASEPDLAERMKMAMRHAGPAILLTSVTDLVAFLVGSSTRIPALQDFCYYAALGIFFDFLYQVTFFVGCAFLASRRQANNKADCLCCVDVDDNSGCCVSGTVGKDWNESQPGLFRSLFSVWVPRATLSPVGRVVVIVIALTLFSIGMYGCVDGIKMNFDNEWFVPDDSRLRDVIDVRDDFGGRNAPAAWWVGEIDYPNRQMDVEDDLVLASGSEYIVNGSLDVWMFAFQDWVRETHPAQHSVQTRDSRRYDVVEPREFYRLLREWASTATGPAATWYHIDNIRWNENRTSLRATKIPYLVTPEPLGDGEVAYDALQDFRRIEKLTKSPMFAWARYFIFWEGFGIVMEEMIRNVCIAGACVFVLISLVTANLWLAVAVLLNVVVIDVCILGWMPIIGVEVNSVSVICVVLAIGLVVDYSVHIAGEFVRVDSNPEITPDTKGFSHGQLRAAFALYKMAPGVGAGGFSTFLAVLPLAMAKSYVFTVFFRMFVLIIGFGLFFGMCFLPVMFSLVNPPANLSAAPVVEEAEFMPLGNYCLRGGVEQQQAVAELTEPTRAQRDHLA